MRGSGHPATLYNLISSASAGSAILTDKTALLIDQALMATVRTFLSLCLCSVCHILLERTLHTILPCVDTLVFQLQGGNKLDDMVDRHTVTENAGDQFCVVPIFWIELLRQALNGRFVATLVLKLEVIAVGTVRIGLLDDLTLGDALDRKSVV